MSLWLVLDASDAFKLSTRSASTWCVSYMAHLGACPPSYQGYVQEKEAARTIMPEPVALVGSLLVPT